MEELAAALNTTANLLGLFSSEKGPAEPKQYTRVRQLSVR
jgi:hypothetical protein